MNPIELLNREYIDLLQGKYALVPGEGNHKAKLLLIGEAPGAQEALQGRPFVGTAGKNLDVFLLSIGLERESLYITNAVKFRPTKQGTSGGLSNRAPTREEVQLFRPWLLQEIALVKPQVMATLGNTALRAVTEENCNIGDVHGVPLAWKGGLRLFPLYHPASVIYRRELKAVYEADLVKLRDLLHRIDV